MNPNDIQHGGDHYKRAGSFQHWDSLPACGWGWEYYIGRATAYLTRVKDEVLDPQKALHFIDKLLHLIDTGAVPEVFQTTQGTRFVADGGNVPASKRVDVEGYLNLYYGANGIRPGSDEAEAIRMLMMARTPEDLRAAREPVARFAASKAPSTSPYRTPGRAATQAVQAMAGADASAAYVNQDSAAATPIPAITGQGEGVVVATYVVNQDSATTAPTTPAITGQGEGAVVTAAPGRTRKRS
jgi:hypothetical protein